MNDILKMWWRYLLFYDNFIANVLMSLWVKEFRKLVSLLGLSRIKGKMIVIVEGRNTEPYMPAVFYAITQGAISSR